MLRHYTVFNVSQCRGLSTLVPQAGSGPVQDHPQCGQIVQSMPNRPAIEVGPQPCYRPSTDTVYLPLLTDFHGTQAYYGVLFHELIHSTGHAKRLDRGLNSDALFDKREYSKEELIAEMGAAFLCRHARIDNSTLD